MSCEQRKEKVVTSIAKRPQGSLDKNTTWAKCRHPWVAQLLIRLGCTINLDPFLEEANNFQVPPCFNRSCLTPLDMCAIGWWDETHKKCFFGDFREGQSKQVRFYRNENGECDTNGAIRDKGRKLALTVKFPRETRLLLGVAVVRKDNNDGEHGT
jgi:hypothetical protein